MQTYPCYVCESPCYLNIGQFIGSLENPVYIDCSRCGKFTIDSSVQGVLENLRREKKLDLATVAKLSGWIYRNQNVQIDYKLLDELLASPPLSVYEKAQRLLQWINLKTSYSGECVDLMTQDVEAWAFCSVANEREIIYLEDYLEKQGLIRNRGQSGGLYCVIITPEGFDVIEKMNFKPNQNVSLVFCAMCFKPEFDPLWFEGFHPAIDQAGYVPVRIDQKHFNNGIMDEIMATIKQSKFLVADLTENRGGIYFEAGIAKGLGLEVIFTCRKDKLEDLHFDVKHFNVLIWEPNKLSEFQRNLIQRIENTIGRGVGIFEKQTKKEVEISD